jgi:3-hydroxypropanoate dehydrogenase
MKKVLGDDALNEIFREARTHGAWLDKPVSDEILRQLYDLMKWGPTSANGSPGRIVFLRTPEAKERLRPALAPGNVEKTITAPVTAIIAYDLLFFEKLPKLFPHTPGMRDLFAKNPQLIEETAKRTLRSRVRTSSSRHALLGSIVVQCQGLIMQRWTRNFSARAKNAKGVNRSFFHQGMSSRISYAILDMAMSRNFSQEGHGWHSTRRARFYERIKGE